MIADKAGVTPGLIYSRFKKKDDVLPYILKKYLTDHVTRLQTLFHTYEPSGSNDVAGRLDILINHLTDEYKAHKGLIRSIGSRYFSSTPKLGNEELELTTQRMLLMVNWIAKGLDDKENSTMIAAFVVQTISIQLQFFVLLDAGQAPLNLVESTQNLRHMVRAYIDAQRPKKSRSGSRRK